MERNRRFFKQFLTVRESEKSRDVTACISETESENTTTFLKASILDNNCSVVVLIASTSAFQTELCLVRSLDKMKIVLKNFQPLHFLPDSIVILQYRHEAKQTVDVW
ncbi:hypothetical protein TNCV_4743321 [Trichonephila clavipes]|nr:hypothetical protein TNCV_4743321 [Trichonephila clavipes]